MRPHLGAVLAVALAGVGACVAALAHFLLVMLFNRLPWSPEEPVRHYYQEVGRSYGQGFLVGFFFCFSLAVAAVGLSTWWDRRKPGLPR
jgi:hypothetical protein